MKVQSHVFGYRLMSCPTGFASAINVSQFIIPEIITSSPREVIPSEKTGEVSFKSLRATMITYVR
jgi:hypothetical protein